MLVVSATAPVARMAATKAMTDGYILYDRKYVTEFNESRFDEWMESLSELIL